MHALVGLALAWMLGLAMAEVLALERLHWGLLAIGGAAALLSVRRQKSLRLIFGAVLLFCLGGLRLTLSHPLLTPEHISYYIGLTRPLTITGVVSAFPEAGQRQTRLSLKVRSVHLQGETAARPVRGRVLVCADGQIPWSYGDLVEVRGLLQSLYSPSDSGYVRHLARQGFHAQMDPASGRRLASRQGPAFSQLLNDVRLAGLRSLNRLFPQPESSLLAGILLGEEGSIPEDVMRAFNQTSTSHVIAISGFNIAILCALSISTLGRMLGARRGAAVSVLAIAAYTILVGASASVVRAAIMAGLAILARWLGRLSDALLGLMATAILMTAFHPGALFDIGFQLSFAATLGLIVLAPPLQSAADGWIDRRMDTETARRIVRPLVGVILLTLAAQVMTVPLTAFHFGRLSLISLLANPVILPLQPPLMMLGGVAMIAAMVWLPAGQVLAWVAWPFAALTIRTVEFFAALPLASVTLGQVSPWTVLAAFAVTFGAAALAKRSLERTRRAAAMLWQGTLLGLAMVTMVVWKLAVEQPDGRLWVEVLDVEGGPGILIQAPGGGHVLFGGGADAVTLQEQLGRRLPFFQRRLEVLIVPSSLQSDQRGVFGLAEHFPVRHVLLPSGSPSGSLDRLAGGFAESESVLDDTSTGMWLDLGAGARLRLFAIEGNATAALVEHGNARILLMPTANASTLELLQRSPWARGLTVIITRFTDGSEGAACEVIHARQPMLVVAAGGGAPACLVPDERTSQGLVLNTVEHGAVQIQTDGEQLSVFAERRGSDSAGY
jgi:competence protein ComEC